MPSSLAAVFDGHGGSMSAEWLQEHLYDDVMQKVEKRLLQPDPHAEPINGRPGVTRSTRAEKFMIDLFQQADDKLIAYLIGGHAWLFRSGAETTSGMDQFLRPLRSPRVCAAMSNCWWTTVSLPRSICSGDACSWHWACIAHLRANWQWQHDSCGQQQ